MMISKYDTLTSEHICITSDILELYKRKYNVLPNINLVVVALSVGKEIDTKVLVSLFPNCKQLFINDCHNVDLEPLESLSLERIVFGNNPTIIDNRPLARMTLLECICIDKKYYYTRDEIMEQSKRLMTNDSK
jgi:hypothetical protein